jgi:hypothetical protein
MLVMPHEGRTQPLISKKSRRGETIKPAQALFLTDALRNPNFLEQCLIE